MYTSRRRPGASGCVQDLNRNCPHPELSKYLPAKPGALVCGPRKAAGRGR
jgi:hypothetical protein